MMTTHIVEIVPEMLPVPPTKGGAVELYVHEITRRLMNDYEVTVISRPSDSVGEPGITYIGIPWSQLDSICFKLKQSLPKKNPIRIISKIQNVYNYSRRVLSHLSTDSEFVHIHNDPNLVTPIRKKLPDSKIILHMHNDHLCEPGFLRKRYLLAVNQADRIICVSQHVKNRILDMYPFLKEKLRTVHNGIDTTTFKKYREWKEVITEYSLVENKVVLYVGRINKEKGVHVLIDAVKILIKDDPEIKLLIVGSSWFSESPKTEYIKQLHESTKSIRNNIIFTGFINGPKLYHIYSASTVFVSPGIWDEPFSLVTLEAQSSSVPVVCTDNGGPTEIVIHNETGLIIPRGDSARMADAIKTILYDKSIRIKMGKKARERAVEVFEWSKIMKELIDVFRGIK